MTRVLELWPLLKECVEKESGLGNGWTNILAEPRYHCHFHLPTREEKKTGKRLKEQIQSNFPNTITQNAKV